jgi:SAM-dependent methyltransferase
MQTLIHPSEALARNLEFYGEHAKQYCRDTAALDMRRSRAAFLELVPEGGHILDAGCGSGRDSAAFMQAGYAVTAIDASPAMVRMARQLKVPAQTMSFQEIDFDQAFDGIWACASLLHVPSAELLDALRRLRKALRPGAVMYVSLKYGAGETFESDGRFFSYHTPEEFKRKLHTTHLQVVRDWTSDDKPYGVHRWMTFLVRRPKN